MVRSRFMESAAEPDHHLRPSPHHPPDPLRGEWTTDLADHRYRCMVQAAKRSRAPGTGLRTASPIRSQRPCKPRSWALVQAKDKFRAPPRHRLCPNEKTSIRAGFGMYFDHYGEGIVNTFDQFGSFGLTPASPTRRVYIQQKMPPASPVSTTSLPTDARNQRRLLIPILRQATPLRLRHHLGRR